MLIEDAVVFITGANRGLGLAFAEEVLKLGARKVYAGMRSPADVDGLGIVPIRLDVTDQHSVAEAAKRCGDTTVLINNAGIARLTSSTLDPNMIEGSREIFETNYFGMIAVSQAFAPVLARNGGGAIINVLSDATWYARPMLAAYSASKSAAWSFTNALRTDLRSQGTAVLGLHVSFMDTDMTQGFGMMKTSPRQAAHAALIALEADEEEALVDDFTRQVKRSFSDEKSIYLDPPPLS